MLFKNHDKSLKKRKTLIKLETMRKYRYEKEVNRELPRSECTQVHYYYVQRDEH